MAGRCRGAPSRHTRLGQETCGRRRSPAPAGVRRPADGHAQGAGSGSGTPSWRNFFTVDPPRRPSAPGGAYRDRVLGKRGPLRLEIQKLDQSPVGGPGVGAQRSHGGRCLTARSHSFPCRGLSGASCLVRHGAPGRIRTRDTRFRRSIRARFGCCSRLVRRPDRGVGVRHRPESLMSAVDVRTFWSVALCGSAALCGSVKSGHAGSPCAFEEHCRARTMVVVAVLQCCTARIRARRLPLEVRSYG